MNLTAFIFLPTGFCKSEHFPELGSIVWKQRSWWYRGGYALKKLSCCMLRSNTQCETQCWMRWEPSLLPKCLYIPHDAVKRHFSSVTFKNIWSEEFLIVHCSFSYSLHFLSPSPPPTLGVVFPPPYSVWITCAYSHTCLAIDLASSEYTGAKESTHGKVCTIDLWRALDAGPALSSLSVPLSFSQALVFTLRLSAPLFPVAEYAFSGLEWRQGRWGKGEDIADPSLRMWNSICGKERRKKTFHPQRWHLGWLGT